MSTRTGQRLVDDYLRRLQAALRDLPAARRREIVDEIQSHIETALADATALDEAAVLTLLDRLGEPDDIAAEARERFGIAPPRPTALEPIAIVLLLFGGFLFGVGWLAGVVLLWLSHVWTRGQKILATLLFPGGLFVVPFLALATSTNTSTCSTVGDVTRCTEHNVSLFVQVVVLLLVVAALVGPIVSAVVLGRRLRQARAAAA